MLKKKVEVHRKCVLSNELKIVFDVFDYRTLDFGEFLLLLAGLQHEQGDDHDELTLAFEMFDRGR
jgi:Ca2+-binding EF-hand superfamily protein